MVRVLILESLKLLMKLSRTWDKKELRPFAAERPEHAQHGAGLARVGNRSQRNRIGRG